MHEVGAFLVFLLLVVVVVFLFFVCLFFYFFFFRGFFSVLNQNLQFLKGDI